MGTVYGDRMIDVLLIDDQPATKTLMLRILANSVGSGMCLHHLADPLLAEEQVLALQPDVVLLDLTMPKMKGLELLQRFRQHPSTHHLPIILLYSADDPGYKAEALAKGASDCMAKLLDPMEMLACLRHHSNAQQLICLPRA